MDYYDPSGYYKNPAGEMIGGISKCDFEAYLGDIEKCTGISISDKQRKLLEEYLKNHDVSSTVDKVTKKKIDTEFKRKKVNLRKEWANEYGIEYPTYSKKQIEGNIKYKKRKVGEAYDLHHIIPRAYGGPNEWWNMIPATNPVEHQGGIHRKDGIYRKIFPRG